MATKTVSATQTTTTNDTKPARKRRYQYPTDLWVIHGKFYDLAGFAKTHPGGDYILQLGKGRDCTELYESVHAFSDLKAKGHFEKLLAKYEVKEGTLDAEYSAPPADQFVWNKDGFYSTVTSRVREHFKDKNYKATYAVYFKIFVMLALYAFCWFSAITSGNWYWAILSGIFTEMVAFCLMHDSSHNSLSKNPTVNYIGLLYSPWILWSNWTWLQHHTYGHHSFTGIHAKDPDVHHSDIFVRRNKKSLKLSHMKYQQYYAYPLYMLLPNQHVGQALLYQLFPFIMKNRVFGVCPILKAPTYMQLHDNIVMLTSVFVHMIIPFYFNSVGIALLLIFCHYTMMGICYFFNVAPNHDTQHTADNHPDFETKIDWGEHQVRTTGNHSVNNGWVDYFVSNLWGGMNYQIEHHLFPTLHHAHYHEASLIVKQTCKEFNIPYTAEDSWVQSMKSFTDLVAKMSIF